MKVQETFVIVVYDESSPLARCSRMSSPIGRFRLTSFRSGPSATLNAGQFSFFHAFHISSRDIKAAIDLHTTNTEKKRINRDLSFFLHHRNSEFLLGDCIHTKFNQRIHDSIWRLSGLYRSCEVIILK